MNPADSVKTPPAACRTCGHPFDTVTCCEGRRPQPGDVTVCVGCGEVYRLTEQLTVRPAELEDLLPLTPDQHRLIDAVQRAARYHRGRKEAP
jgi:hypothetical protein